MFCDGCGSQLQTNQPYCSGCGKAVTGSIVGYPRRSRIQEHVRLLAIFWFAFSAIEVIGGLVLLVLANTLFFRLNEFGQAGPPPRMFLHVLFTILALFILTNISLPFLPASVFLNPHPWPPLL